MGEAIIRYVVGESDYPEGWTSTMLRIHREIEGEELRLCPVCGELKSTDEFGMRGGRLQSWCKACRGFPVVGVVVEKLTEEVKGKLDALARHKKIYFVFEGQLGPARGWKNRSELMDQLRIKRWKSLK